MESFCVRAFGEALEIVPFTLAENAGLNPIQIVTELRNLHAQGQKYHGINVKKVGGRGGQRGPGTGGAALGRATCSAAGAPLPAITRALPRRPRLLRCLRAPGAER
jgi:hypothetical protein